MPKRITFLLLMGLWILPVPVGGKDENAGAGQITSDGVPVYGYEVVDSFPHDPNAFTQGLEYHSGFLYEGTGLYGGSSLRKVVLETGEVLIRRRLASEYFGEGITVYSDTIFQLTWLNHVGFVYVELDEFELIDTFSYSTPGWGLTHDDTSLIMSDGTDKLYHLDPHTYEEVGRVHVTADGSPVYSLNELELIRGLIYANILDSDSIAAIDPETGEVVAWLDLTGILSGPSPGPLNGIAFDPDSVRLFVTGKRWPTLFEIWTDPLDYAPEIVDYSPPSPLCAYIDTPVLLEVSAEDLDPADSLEYTWSVNGVVEPSAQDSSYQYVSSISTVDTVVAGVTDGIFSDSATWIIYVEIAGVDGTAPRGEGGPDVVTLYQNCPNPFRPATAIDFTIAERPGISRKVRLSIHDVSGREVITLIESELPPGDHRVTWDGRDERGQRVSPGIFFCVLKVGDEMFSGKMAVME